jgi:hypothetical protein
VTAQAKSARRLRVSGLSTEARGHLLVGVQGVLAQAERMAWDPGTVRDELVAVVRRLVTRHALLSLGYRFEEAISPAEGEDAVLVIARSAFDESGTFRHGASDLPEQIVAGLGVCLGVTSE